MSGFLSVCACVSLNSHPTHTQPPQGPVHTALTVAREEGVAKLWSGATATTIRQGSNQMSLFWGKAACDTLIWDKHVSRGRAAPAPLCACSCPALPALCRTVTARC